MVTQKLAEHVVKTMVDDITYCDECKKAIDMNMSIDGRSVTDNDIQIAPYYKVRNDAERDAETMHYCDHCMMSKIYELLTEDDIELDIVKKIGFVIPKVIADMKTKAAVERMKRQSARVRDRKEAMEASIRAEEERYRRLRDSHR